MIQLPLVVFEDDEVLLVRDAPETCAYITSIAAPDPARFAAYDAAGQVLDLAIAPVTLMRRLLGVSWTATRLHITVAPQSPPRHDPDGLAARLRPALVKRQHRGQIPRPVHLDGLPLAELVEWLQYIVNE